MKYLKLFEEVNKEFILTDEFKKFFGDWEKDGDISVVTDRFGKPLRVYHQTSKENKESILKRGFEYGKELASKHDPFTPYGFFFKSHNKDIGLKGKEQLEGYLNIRNPFIVDNQKDMIGRIKNDKYHKLLEKLNSIDTHYNKKIDDLLDVNDYDEDKLKPIFKKWEEKYNTTALQAKSELDKYIKSKGYDGFILKEDVGGIGKAITDTYVIFSPKQFIPIKY